MRLVPVNVDQFLNRRLLYNNKTCLKTLKLLMPHRKMPAAPQSNNPVSTTCVNLLYRLRINQDNPLTMKSYCGLFLRLISLTQGTEISKEICRNVKQAMIKSLVQSNNSKCRTIKVVLKSVAPDLPGGLPLPITIVVVMLIPGTNSNIKRMKDLAHTVLIEAQLHLMIEVTVIQMNQQHQGITITAC